MKNVYILNLVNANGFVGQFVCSSKKVAMGIVAKHCKRNWKTCIKTKIPVGDCKIIEDYFKANTDEYAEVSQHRFFDK